MGGSSKEVNKMVLKVKKYKGIKTKSLKARAEKKLKRKITPREISMLYKAGGKRYTSTVKKLTPKVTAKVTYRGEKLTKMPKHLMLREYLSKKSYSRGTRVYEGRAENGNIIIVTKSGNKRRV